MKLSEKVREVFPARAGMNRGSEVSTTLILKAGEFEYLDADEIDASFTVIPD